MRPIVQFVIPAVACLLLAASPAPANPSITEIEAKLAALKKDLGDLEKQLEALRQTTTTDQAKPTPAPPLPKAAQANSPARSPQAKEASDRFLDWLIVIAFLAAAISFIVGRYRDSLSSSGGPEVTNTTSASDETPIPGTGAVVFYTRNNESPSNQPDSDQPTPAEDKFDHPTEPAQVKPEPTGPAPQQTDLSSSDDGPDSSVPKSASSPDDLRVEPKTAGHQHEKSL